MGLHINLHVDLFIDLHTGSHMRQHMGPSPASAALQSPARHRAETGGA